MIQGFTSVKDKTRFVKALIYGQAGAGKTRFCADAPNPVWLDFESSTETLYHWPEYQHIPVKRPANVEELRRDVKEAVKDPEVETVVIDSITTSLDYYLRQRLANSAPNRDKFVFYEADYKYATQVFTDLFGFLQDAPINVLIIGHERVLREPETGKVIGIFPDVTPRLQQAVTRLVNVVAYMESEAHKLQGIKRRLYLNRTAVIEAKNRLAIQEVFIENPSYKEIFS